MIERGHAVAQAARDLAGELRSTITLHQIARLISPTPRPGFYLNGPDLDAAAYRLRVACELQLLVERGDA